MKKISTTENAPKVVKDVAKWLRENLYLVRDNDARFQRVTVFHLVKGNKRGEEVFHENIPKKADEEWSHSAALEIYNKLYAEAATLGGLQKYALYAFASDDNDSHVSRFVLRVEGASEDDDDDPLASEGPDRAGLASQAMRHAEMYAKIQTGSVMTTLGALQSMVNRQSAIIEKLLDARLESIETVEALISNKHQREIELMQAETKANAVKEVASKLALFVPALANKLAGQPLFPVQANAMMMTLKGLLGSIVADEGQMKYIMDGLKPEQAVAFMHLLEAVSKSVDDNGLPVDGARNGAASASPETGE